MTFLGFFLYFCVYVWCLVPPVSMCLALVAPFKQHVSSGVCYLDPLWIKAEAVPCYLLGLMWYLSCLGSKNWSSKRLVCSEGASPLKIKKIWSSGLMVLHVT